MQIFCWIQLIPNPSNAGLKDQKTLDLHFGTQNSLVKSEDVVQGRRKGSRNRMHSRFQNRRNLRHQQRYTALKGLDN
jgi:hypothetical protein